MQSQSTWGKGITVAIFSLISLILLIAGGWLISLDGSPYYLLAGIVLTVITVLWIKDNIFAIWLYEVGIALTLAWSVWEVGTDFWALAPRLDIWFLLGVWILLPFTNRAFAQHHKVKEVKYSLASMLFAVLILLGISIFSDPQEINGTITRTQSAISTQTAGVSAEDWVAYGRTQAGERYSPLTQINVDNVKDLEVAWVYHTGDLKTDKDSGESTYEVTPLKVNNTLFLCTTHQFLDALDAETGKRLWRFDPHLAPTKRFQHMTCRGVSYYDVNTAAVINPKSATVSQTVPSTVCPRKVLLPVNDGRLIAVNADTGEACQDFGENGTIDLKRKMPYAYPGGYNPTSPPL